MPVVNVDRPLNAGPTHRVGARRGSASRRLL